MNMQGIPRTCKKQILELKKSGQLKYVQDIVCQIYETNEHATDDCQS